MDKDVNNKEVQGYKEALGDCPHCGRCPTCGRSNYRPWNPYPYPYWYDYEPGYWTSDNARGNITVRYS